MSLPKTSLREESMRWLKTSYMSQTASGLSLCSASPLSPALAQSSSPLLPHMIPFSPFRSSSIPAPFPASRGLFYQNACPQSLRAVPLPPSLICTRWVMAAPTLPPSQVGMRTKQCNSYNTCTLPGAWLFLNTL